MNNPLSSGNPFNTACFNETRFDLLFVVLDSKESELDRLVAERVGRNHRYISANEKGDALYNE